MRLWSLHPRYLDPKGLVALWREGLLAQAVAAGRTRGYRHHPQLARFLEAPALSPPGRWPRPVRSDPAGVLPDSLLLPILAPVPRETTMSIDLTFAQGPLS